MKIMVCGGRDFDDYQRLSAALAFTTLNPILDCSIISGGAKGADKMTEIFANAHNVPITIIKADWDKHGRKAGMLRNIQMLNMCPDVVYAFWDGRSKGTEHSITEAGRNGIRVVVFNY